VIRFFARQFINFIFCVFVCGISVFMLFSNEPSARRHAGKRADRRLPTSPALLGPPSRADPIRSGCAACCVLRQPRHRGMCRVSPSLLSDCLRAFRPVYVFVSCPAQLLLLLLCRRILTYFLHPG